MKLASDFVPTVIVVVVLVLLAFWIVHESDKNNKEVIDAVKQAQAERQKALSNLERIIKQNMEHSEKWPQLKNQMKALSPQQ